VARLNLIQQALELGTRAATAGVPSHQFVASDRATLFAGLQTRRLHLPPTRGGGSYCRSQLLDALFFRQMTNRNR
jgi:hypothetical protein